MKTIICGSRTIQSYDVFLRALNTAPFLDKITVVFSGMAAGPDVFGYRWAMERKLPVRQFYPDWNKLGKPAGLIRNMEMCTYADAIIAVWDGRSTGTGHIIKYSSHMDPPLLRHIINLGPQQETLIDYARNANLFKVR